MRSATLVLALAAALSLQGCGIFDPQDVRLLPSEVATLEASLGGKLEEKLAANRDQVLDAVSSQLGVTVENLKLNTDSAIASLRAPALEAAAKFAEKAIPVAVGNPTPPGLMAALLAGAVSILGVVRVFSDLKNRKK